MKGKTVERIKRDEATEELIKTVASGLVSLFIYTFQNTEKKK